jgi:hypothetical protein
VPGAAAWIFSGPRRRAASPLVVTTKPSSRPLNTIRTERAERPSREHCRGTAAHRLLVDPCGHSCHQNPVKRPPVRARNFLSGCPGTLTPRSHPSLAGLTQLTPCFSRFHRPGVHPWAAGILHPVSSAVSPLRSPTRASPATRPEAPPCPTATGDQLVFSSHPTADIPSKGIPREPRPAGGSPNGRLEIIRSTSAVGHYFPQKTRAARNDRGSRAASCACTTRGRGHRAVLGATSEERVIVERLTLRPRFGWWWSTAASAVVVNRKAPGLGSLRPR